MLGAMIWRSDAALAGCVAGLAGSHSRRSAAGAQAEAIPLRRRRRRNGTRSVILSRFSPCSADRFCDCARRQAELRARAEFQKQILDKFSSGKEFADFLGTEGSQRFSGELLEPFLRIAGANSARHAQRDNNSRARNRFPPPDAPEAWVCCAGSLSALGAGLLISAAASYHFSKKWNGGGPATPARRYRTARTSVEKCDAAERKPGVCSGRRGFGRAGSDCGGIGGSAGATHGCCRIPGLLCKDRAGAAGYVRRASGNEALADIFFRIISAFSARRSFPIQRAQFRDAQFNEVTRADAPLKAYLYKIASSLLVDHWRRVKRERRWSLWNFLGGEPVTNRRAKAIHAFFPPAQA